MKVIGLLSEQPDDINARLKLNDAFKFHDVSRPGEKRIGFNVR
jgi:hypothetical protein